MRSLLNQVIYGLYLAYAAVRDWLRHRKMLHCTRYHQSEPYKQFVRGYSLTGGFYPHTCGKCGATKYRNSRGEWYYWELHR
jgi:hypothetical protein